MIDSAFSQKVALYNSLELLLLCKIFIKWVLAIPDCGYLSVCQCVVLCSLVSFR